MKTSLYLENQSTSLQSSYVGLAASYPKILQLEAISQKLLRKDDELFCRIVEAVKNNDEFLSKMLASELIKIRNLERNLLVTIELIYRSKTSR